MKRTFFLSMERGERPRIEALSSGELKRKMKWPLLVRETIQGLDKGQRLAFASIHSRDGRLPKTYLWLHRRRILC